MEKNKENKSMTKLNDEQLDQVSGGDNNILDSLRHPAMPGVMIIPTLERPKSENVFHPPAMEMLGVPRFNPTDLQEIVDGSTS